MGTDSQHTPGRWHWWTSNSWRRLKSDLGHGRTANVLEPTRQARDGHPDLLVTEADARLIASAPEMFEALQNAQRALAAMIAPNAVETTSTAQAWAMCVEAETKARAALSKATGSPRADDDGDRA